MLALLGIGIQANFPVNLITNHYAPLCLLHTPLIAVKTVLLLSKSRTMIVGITPVLDPGGEKKSFRMIQFLSASMSSISPSLLSQLPVLLFVLPIVWQHGFFLSILWMSFLLDEFCHKLGTHIAFDCCQITGNYWYPHQPHLYSLLRYGYKILAWQQFYRPQERQKVKRKKSKSVWLKFLWQHGLKPAAVKLITDPTLCNLRYISETVLYILL